MVELNLINPEHQNRSKLVHNKSHKFESAFVGLDIPQNNSVMLQSLSNSSLGVWVRMEKDAYSSRNRSIKYNVIATYHYADYPAKSKWFRL